MERPQLNPNWWALLRDGSGSAADRWFDIDWAAGAGKVLLPVLDEPIEALDVTIEGALLRVGSWTFPMASGTEHLPAGEALERQHYRPMHWRQPARNVLRFFTIDQLVAVRVEHAEVAVAVDTVPRLLLDHDAFDGVRVDHVDGLADPAAYLHGLRELVGDRWLLVEKILAPGEHLPAHWPVDGTTGYEHARVLEHALLDTAGWADLARTWAGRTADDRPFREWELQARREVLAAGLRPDRDRIAAVAERALGDTDSDTAIDADTVRAAVTELSVQLRRYRTYLPDDPDGRTALDAARREATERDDDVASLVARLAEAIAAPAGDDATELRTRWQQLTGPATAKGVEDRVFWRWGPLSSLGEVGGHPEAEPGAVAELHAQHAAVQAGWPTTMLAGTTHDVARSEDVRAIGLALAAAPNQWRRVIDEWLGTEDFPDLDVPIQWLALQTVATTPELTADRLEAFLVKAAREADLHTAWTAPVAVYEQRLAGLARDLLVWPPIVELAASLD
ncbi:MAG: malto-oligosyltrehalose synthase, partial [Ilumatobacteraceae bacterium]